MTYDIEQIKSWADRGEVIGSMVVKELIGEYTKIVQEHEVMRQLLAEFADYQERQVHSPERDIAIKARGVLSTIKAKCSECASTEVRECGFSANEVCTTLVCKAHTHPHGDEHGGPEYVSNGDEA